MCDTSETCGASSTRLRTRRAQDLSYKLKVNEFDDLTNTCCPEVDRDRDANGIVRGGVRMCNFTTPRNHHQPTCPRAQSYTQAPTTRIRAGALTFPSSCLDGGVTHKPGFTGRLWVAHAPQHTTATQNEPSNTPQETSKSRTVAEPW